MTDRKDVYAAMAPATYTRTLGSGVGRSPTTIEAHRPPTLALTARRLRRRKPRDGAKALRDGRLRLETKTDPEVLEIYRGARAETKVRHVRSAAGVRRYHAPIGTPIVGGHAIAHLPSAGGGRVRAGANAKRPTSGLIGRRSPGGMSGLRGIRKVRGKVRRAVPGNGGGFNGGVPGGAGGFGGLVGGGAFGSLFGSGKKPPKGKKPAKAKKVKAPKKGKGPGAGKRGTGSGGSGSGNGKGTSTPPKKSTTTPTPSQGELDQAAQQMLLLPPDRLGNVLRTMPYNVLAGVLRTIQDPEFPDRVASGGGSNGAANAPAAGGSKSLSIGAAWLETKEPQPASGDERCVACGVDLDPADQYDTIPTGKGYELVVCVPCAAETKAGGRGSGDSGIPGHLPEQLRRYWTTGKGKAQWAASPHPYTALVRALSEEEIPRRMIHGLAANLFRDVFGIYPAQRPRALGGSTHGYAR